MARASLVSGACLVPPRAACAQFLAILSVTVTDSSVLRKRRFWSHLGQHTVTHIAPCFHVDFCSLFAEPQRAEEDTQAHLHRCCVQRFIATSWLFTGVQNPSRGDNAVYLGDLQRWACSRRLAKMVVFTSHRKLTILPEKPNAQKRKQLYGTGESDRHPFAPSTGPRFWTNQSTHITLH